MHEQHKHHDQTDYTKEYIKFSFVILFIVSSALLVAEVMGLSYMESLMSVFFIVFGGFKLINLKEFAYGFQSYDLIAKRSLAYSYAYPFIQFTFAFLYLLGAGSMWWVNVAVIIVSLISGIGVIQTLGSKAKVHCVCLGSFVKLPLSTVSFVEDFSMAIMATAMLFAM